LRQTRLECLWRYALSLGKSLVLAGRVDFGAIVLPASSKSPATAKAPSGMTATAEYLGIPLSTLKYKMDRLDVRHLAKRLRGA